MVQRHCTIQCGELNLTHYLNLSCSIRLTQSEGTYTLFFCLNNFWTIFVYVFKNCTLHHPNPDLLSSGRCGGYKMLRFCGFCLIFPCHLFNNKYVFSIIIIWYNLFHKVFTNWKFVCNEWCSAIFTFVTNNNHWSQFVLKWGQINKSLLRYLSFLLIVLEICNFQFVANLPGQFSLSWGKRADFCDVSIEYWSVCLLVYLKFV